MRTKGSHFVEVTSVLCSKHSTRITSLSFYFKNKEPEKKTQAEKYLESREGMIERLSEYVRGEKLERMLVYYKVKAIEGMTDEQLKNATNQVFNKKKEKKNGN